MSPAAGAFSTTIDSRIDAISGRKPICTSRLATARPCNSATALEIVTSSRKAKIPASTASGPSPTIGPIPASGPSATCLFPSTPAMQTMPP